MKCYYYIKLPRGGEVRIPAEFTPLKKTDVELNELIEVYYKSLKDEEISTKDAKNELWQHFKDSKVGLHHSTIVSLLNNSTEKTLIDNINKELQQHGSEKNLYDAIHGKVWSKDDKFDYINTKGKLEEGGLTFEEFLGKLQKPISPFYFKNVEPLGLLGTTNVYNIRKELKETIEDTLAYEGFADLEKDLERFVRRVIPRDKWKNNVFHNMNFSGAANDSIVIHSDQHEDPIYLYNGDSHISLFVGLLRELGTKMSVDEAKVFVEAFNADFPSNKLEVPKTEEDVTKFFIGKYGSQDYTPGGFDQMLKLKPGAEFIGRFMIPIVAEYVEFKNESEKAKKEFLRAGHKLAKFLSASKYRKNARESEELLKQKHNKASEENNRIWINNNYNQIKQFFDNRLLHYSQAKKKTFTGDNAANDAYNFIKSNVNLKKDVILVKSDYFDHPRYVIPTDLHIRKKTITVEGVIKTDTVHPFFGKLEGDDITVTYRTLEREQPSRRPETVAKAQKMNTSESIVIYPKKDSKLPPELVKKLLTRGSIISVKGFKANTVKAVYPSGYAINNKADTIFEGFQGVSYFTAPDTALVDKEFTDADSEERTQLLQKKYMQVTKGRNNNYLYVEDGDIIKFKDGEETRYNRVVHVEGDTLYILIKKGDDKHSITSTPRSSVETIYKPKSEVYTLPEGLSVAKFSEKVEKEYSIADSHYSYFTNYELAQNGDFVLFEDEIYKIVDKPNNVLARIELNQNTDGYTITGSYVRKDNTAVFNRFATTRDISSKFAIDIAETNNRHLFTEKESDRHVEAVYLIPADMSSVSGTILSSGNMNIGRVGTKSHYYNDDGTKSSAFTSKYIDVTKNVVKKLAEKRGEDATGLYIKDVSGYHERFNKNLFEIPFHKLKKSSKMEGLQNGAFIVFMRDGNPNNSGYNSYRIMNVTDTLVTLEYSTFTHDGKIVSIVKEVSLDHVLENGQRLYLPRGNRKIPKLDAEGKGTKQKKSPKEKKRELIGEIATRFKEVYDVETTVIVKSPQDRKKDKAWIHFAKTKAPKIVINLGHNKTNESDLVHEYLHLFLFALKYKGLQDSTNIYEELLIQHRDNTQLDEKDLSMIEEDFIDSISSFMAGELDTPTVSSETFLQAFNAAIKSIGIEEMDLEENIFTVLNTTMSEVFGKRPNRLTDPTLLFFEANFRDWLSTKVKEDKKFKMNCN